MDNQPTQNQDRSEAQRDALKQSEKQAAEKQPGSFKDRENEEKIVEIGGDRTGNPIEGIDPK